MTRIFKLTAIAALCAVASAASHAGIVFTFSQSGADVVMNSSGVIDTNGLVLQQSVSQWGSAGIEENGNHDIMGGTTVGQVDVSFGFNAGTSFAPWVSANGPWSSSNFNTVVNNGVRGFTTYIRAGGQGPQLPGLGVERADIVGGLWSPDQNWTFANQTIASLNMTPGTYTVTDAVSGEFITFQIGAVQVPEPTTLLLAGLALAGLGLSRRKQQTS